MVKTLRRSRKRSRRHRARRAGARRAGARRAGARRAGMNTHTHMRRHMERAISGSKVYG